MIKTGVAFISYLPSAGQTKTPIILLNYYKLLVDRWTNRKTKVLQAHPLCNLCTRSTSWQRQPSTIVVCMTYIMKKVDENDTGKIRTTEDKV